MIRTILKKEFLENLLSFRFTVSSILMLILTGVSAYVLTLDYNRQMEDYQLRDKLKNERLDDSFTYGGRGGLVIQPVKPPSKLSSLFRGVQSEDVIFYFGSLDDNPVPLLFPLMDLLLIVGTIMSLLAILFSYDATCGEKEVGTLRAIFSNQVPRGTVLIGKWLGGLLCLFLPFTAAFLVAFLVAMVQSEAGWNADDWLSVGAVFVTSLVYISAFFALGLWISSRTKAGATAILASLLAWVLFVLIIPTLPYYIASEIFPVPSAAKAEYEMYSVVEEEWRVAVRKVKAPYYREGYSDREVEKLTADEIEKINASFQKKRGKIENAYFEGSMIQMAVTWAVSMMSPFSCFTRAGHELASVGVLDQVYFFKEATKRYQEILDQYIEEKWKEATEKDPDFSYDSRLDIRDRPQFTFKEEKFVFRLVAAGVSLLVLVIFNALFFLLAFKAFLRYDVR